MISRSLHAITQGTNLDGTVSPATGDISAHGNSGQVHNDLLYAGARPSQLRANANVTHVHALQAPQHHGKPMQNQTAQTQRTHATLLGPPLMVEDFPLLAPFDPTA